MEKKARTVNPWLTHVREFRKEHPEMKYKDVLVNAKLTYKIKSLANLK